MVHKYESVILGVCLDFLVDLMRKCDKIAFYGSLPQLIIGEIILATRQNKRYYFSWQVELNEFILEGWYASKANEKDFMFFKILNRS
jgi:hypothetical protein